MLKIILATAGLAISGAIFFMFTQPTYDKINATNAEIAQYDQALNKANELQQLKQTLLDRYNHFAPASLDRLQKLLPDHVDNVRLILDLDYLAGTHNMALQNVSINVPGEGSKQASAIGAMQLSSEKFDSLTMKFTVQGTYAQFLSFLQDLESSLRIVDVVQLTVSSGGAGTADSDPILHYDMTVRTYWLK